MPEDVVSQQRTQISKFVNYALAFLARHAIAAIISVLFTALGVPYLIILVYALDAGLPAFEVFDALGTHIMRFAVFSAIATVVILATLLLPGVLLIFDRWSVSDEEGADKDRSIKRQLVLSRLRWYMAIVPGLVVFSPLVLLADTPHHMYHIPVIIIAMSGVLLLLWHLFARYKGIRLQINDYREVLRSPSGLLAPNFISFSYLMVFSRIAESELLTLRIDNVLYRTLIALVIGMFCLMFVSIWRYNLDVHDVDGHPKIVWSVDSLKWSGFTPLLLLVFMVFQYPGGITLLKRYLAWTRLGGGAAAILTVDSEVAKAWPQTFGNSGGPRSDKVKILLLGRDKIFIEPDNSDKAAVVGPLMIDRSRVREIMFLPREHNTEVPADSPSK